MPLKKTEALHMIISLVTISLAFSMGAAFLGLDYFLFRFPVILLTLGTGFVLHELGHKLVAQRFGCFAEYRAWVPGLLLALGLAVMSGGSLVFAAPGAVHIGGKRISLKEDGIISLSGPLVNILLGLFFLLLVFSVAPAGTLLGKIASLGAYVNFFLAAFNLIPFPPLDGSKVIRWNVLIWLMMIATSASLVMFWTELV